MHSQVKCDKLIEVMLLYYRHPILTINDSDCLFESYESIKHPVTITCTHNSANAKPVDYSDNEAEFTNDYVAYTPDSSRYPQKTSETWNLEESRLTTAEKLQVADPEQLLEESIKLQIFLHVVHHLLSVGHRILVFSQSKAMLDIIKVL